MSLDINTATDAALDALTVEHDAGRRRPRSRTGA